MHLWRLCTALLLFTSLSATAAVVYKWTDKDGVLHYSDQPVPGAEQIVTSSGATNGIGGTGLAAPGGPSRPQISSLRPASLAIESPAREQVFFNDDVIPVRLHIEPGLQAGQTIVWRLNGRQLDDQPPTAVAFSLQSLPRGTYVVAVTVTDSATGEGRSADSVTFYVRQPSELAPQHKKS